MKTVSFNPGIRGDLNYRLKFDESAGPIVQQLDRWLGQQWQMAEGTQFVLPPDPVPAILLAAGLHEPLGMLTIAEKGIPLAAPYFLGRIGAYIKEREHFDHSVEWVGLEVVINLSGAPSSTVTRDRMAKLMRAPFSAVEMVDVEAKALPVQGVIDSILDQGWSAEVWSQNRIHLIPPADPFEAVVAAVVIYYLRGRWPMVVRTKGGLILESVEAQALSISGRSLPQRWWQAKVGDVLTALSEALKAEVTFALGDEHFSLLISPVGAMEGVTFDLRVGDANILKRIK